jgi:hypothetical protein
VYTDLLLGVLKKFALLATFHPSADRHSRLTIKLSPSQDTEEAQGSADHHLLGHDRRVRPPNAVALSHSDRADRLTPAAFFSEAFQAYFNSNVHDTGRSSESESCSASASTAAPARNCSSDHVRPRPSPPVISLEGRMYPVQLAYLAEPITDYVDTAIQTVFDIHAREPKGNILVFLTGREEIDRCLQEIADRLPSYVASIASLHLVPSYSSVTDQNPCFPSHSMPKALPKLTALGLHAGLSANDQALVFAPTGSNERKVIVSTNIAEASVTIDGIVYVVDCGFVKLRRYDPALGMDILGVERCSVASLNQRAGRAGRLSPGKCLRLFLASDLATLEPSTPPEVTRADVALPMLQLKALGIRDPVKGFDWLTRPTPQAFGRAVEFLTTLGALDEGGRLRKPEGEAMSEMPVDVQMAAIVRVVRAVPSPLLGRLTMEPCRAPLSSSSTRRSIAAAKRSSRSPP